MLENQLLLIVGLQHNRILVEALDPPGKFNAAHQVNRQENSILACIVQKRLLDILGQLVHILPCCKPDCIALSFRKDQLRNRDTLLSSLIAPVQRSQIMLHCQAGPSLNGAISSRRMVEAHHGSQADHEALFGRRIALVSVSLGLLLSVSKIWIGTAAGSASVVSDGFESAGDVFSSGVVYAGLWLASKPPDNEHPYGHGRYETLAGLAIGGFLLVTGTAIFWNSLTHFGERHGVGLYALYPLFAALVLKILLASTKFSVGRRISSTALQADAWHDVTDLVSTGIALLATSLALLDPQRFGVADHLGGMLIGIIIFFLSIQVVSRVVDQLLDTMPEPEKLAEIRRIALSVPGARGIEKCFARQTGLQYHVDLHLEVDGEMTVRESHEIASLVRHAIKDGLSWVADVLVHVEPSALLADDPLSSRAISTRF